MFYSFIRLCASMSGWAHLTSALDHQNYKGVEVWFLKSIACEKTIKCFIIR